MSTIPPTSSLVRYDNPVLVTRNTDKRTPKVDNSFKKIYLNLFFNKG